MIHDFWPVNKIPHGQGCPRLFVNEDSKSADGATVYQVSLSLLNTVLIKHARSNGIIDEKRAYVLERVHGHFDEHIMFNASPANIALGVLSDMSQDYDHMGRSAFESLYERSSREIAPKLPDVVNKEIVAHLALFQRVDTVPLSNQRGLRKFGQYDKW